jgi:hypothetical protein
MSSKNNIHIQFDSIEECIDLKNKLIMFIKQNKRIVKDKGLDPNLNFTYIKTKTHE